MNTEQAQRIMAYYDKQVSAREQQEIEALLERDDDAKNFFASLSFCDQMARQGFDEMLNEPVPPHLVQTIMAQPVDAGDDHVTPLKIKPQRFYWQLATAASLVLAIVVGLLQYQSDNSTETIYSKLLQVTLETVPSGSLRSSDDGAWQLMPVATFELASKTLCREYAGMRDSEPFYGLACRDEGGKWSDLLEPGFDSNGVRHDSQNYSPAEGEHDQIERKLAEMGGARSLSQDEEKGFLDARWQ